MDSKILKFTLPEFVFFDGSGPDRQLWEDRTVIHHVRTATTFEVISLKEAPMIPLKDGIQTFEFEHLNRLGTKEKFLFAVHISIADKDELAVIANQAFAWYAKYLDWEDDGFFSEFDT